MLKISDKVKLDTALSPRSLASTNATGQYHPMKDYERAAFVFSAKDMADAKTVVAQVYQATDAEGTSAKVITNAAATITCPAGVTSATVTATAVTDGDVITINDQVFTCEDTDPDIDEGQFDSGADDTAAMANLATAINHLLPDLYATSSLGVLTVKARERGEATVTIADATGTMVPAALEAIGYIEIEPSFLDLDGGFTHVALKLTTNATIVVAADLLRQGGRYSPVQQVGASKEDVS